jgi:hypothetical protein
MDMAENRIRDEDFDSTTATLREGVRQVAIERAISEVDGWQKKLEASGDPGLQPIAANLRELKELLVAEELDVEEIGRLLVELGDQTQAVAVSGTASPIADKLQLLSRLLTDEGRTMRGEELPQDTF